MEQDKIWDTFQNDESLLELGFPARKRFEFLAENIPKGSQTLNIGIGNGYLETILAQKGVSVSCLDPSGSAIDNIRKRLKLGDMAQQGYSQSIPFPDMSFDYVIMSEVLEHLEDKVIENTLIELKRVLKVGGTFLGTVPADENLKAGVVVCPKCGEQFHRWGHVQSFSQESLFNKLDKEFKEVAVKRVLLSDFNQLNWKGKVMMLLKKIQVVLNIKGSTQNLFFVANRCGKKI